MHTNEPFRYRFLYKPGSFLRTIAAHFGPGRRRIGLEQINPPVKIERCIPSDREATGEQARSAGTAKSGDRTRVYSLGSCISPAYMRFKVKDTEDGQAVLVRDQTVVQQATR